jgi:CheY-like chemotaxis protein
MAASERGTGELLVEAGVIKQEDLEAAVKAAAANGVRLLSQILEWELAGERDLCKVLAEHHGHPVVVLEHSVIDLKSLGLVPRVVAEQHNLLPVALDEETLTVATADVEARDVLEQVAFASGRRVVPLLCLDKPLAEAITRAYDEQDAGASVSAGPHVDEALSGLPLLVLERPPKAPEDAIVGELIELADTDAPEIEAAADDDVSDDRPVVLVVDDEADIRALLARVLGKDGYRVLQAADGREAMDILRRVQPHVVLLDAMLPEIHGFEICRAIKGSATLQQIPVIMISAVYKGWENARDIQESHGADAFVEKPFEVPYVRELVARMLGTTAPREEPDAERSKEIATQRNTAGISMKMGDLADAERAGSRWAELDPFDPQAWLLLGNLHTRRAAHEEAMRCYERAATFGPSVFAAFKNLALTYEVLGFVNRGYLAWVRAAELAPPAAQAEIQARLRARYPAYG